MPEDPSATHRTKSDVGVALEVDELEHAHEPLPTVETVQARREPTGAPPAEVVDPVVAVPAGPVVPDLNEPRPHLLRRGRDGDGPGGAGRTRENLVARHRPPHFLVGGSPPRVPRTYEDPVDDQHDGSEAEAGCQPHPRAQGDRQCDQDGHRGQEGCQNDPHDRRLGPHAASRLRWHRPPPTGRPRRESLWHLRSDRERGERPRPPGSLGPWGVVRVEPQPGGSPPRTR